MNTADHPNAAILDRMYACWRAVDLRGLLECMAPDCVYEDMAMRESWRGHVEIEQFAQRVWSGLAGFDVRFSRRFATDTDGAGAWTIRGRATGTIAGFTVADAPVKFSGLSLYGFRDGRITSVVDCWDFDELRRELERAAAGGS